MSFSKQINHFNSQQTAAIDLYSASVDDRLMVTCFFDFHEIKESPRKTAKLVTDRPVSGQAA